MVRIYERVRKYSTTERPAIKTLENEYNMPHTTLSLLGKGIAPKRQSVREVFFDGLMSFLCDECDRLILHDFDEARDLRNFMFRAFLEYHRIRRYTF